MKIFLLVVAIIFVVLLAFYIFVSVRMSIILKDKKDEYLSKLNAHEQDVIRGYLENSKVEFKDVFKKRSK